MRRMDVGVLQHPVRKILEVQSEGNVGRESRGMMYSEGPR